MNLTSLMRRLMTREGFLTIFTVSFGGLAGLVVGIPIIGYVLSPLLETTPQRWQDVRFANGPKQNKVVTVDAIPIGTTEEVVFLALDPLPWAGTTENQGAWLRRTGQSTFIAYAIYCTHLGCPVHWLSTAKIFLCPCHGSVFTADGVVAGGPAPRPLFTSEVRVSNGRVQIKTHPLPVVT